MKTLIAIPCMDTVPVGFAESILYLDKPQGTSVCLKTNTLVYDSRNILSLTAIEQEFERVLWLDSDMTFPSDTLRRLHDDIDGLNADMITGVYYRRKHPHVPVIYSKLDPPAPDETGKLIKQVVSYEDYPRDKIFPVRGCGFGCVMTTTKLLKAVWDKYGPAFSPFLWAGEDLSFCHRVNELGFQILCDPAVQCGHIGQYIYGRPLNTKGEVME